MTGTVFQIQRYCIRDGRGIRTCVFVKGCPLHCPWCHNPEGLSTEPQTDCDGKTYGTLMTDEEVFAEVVKDKIYYGASNGGVTFTGGEPLMHAEFVAACAARLKLNGISVAVETSGAADESAVKSVLPYIDSVLFDIKSFDVKALSVAVGADKNVIMRNLRLFSAVSEIVLRCPIIPGFNDDKAHFAAVGELAASTENVTGVELLPYHGLGAEKSKKLGMPVADYGQISASESERFADEVRRRFDKVIVL